MPGPVPVRQRVPMLPDLPVPWPECLLRLVDQPWRNGSSSDPDSDRLTFETSMFRDDRNPANPVPGTRPGNNSDRKLITRRNFVSFGQVRSFRADGIPHDRIPKSQNPRISGFGRLEFRIVSVADGSVHRPTGRKKRIREKKHESRIRLVFEAQFFELRFSQSRSCMNRSVSSRCR